MYITLKNPILSICIATYNRSRYISVTLDSIVLQLSEQVEIVIVDGNSTDNTKEVVESYEARGLVRYIRLPEKGGVDQDYCKAVEHAQGEYCWLFTDDDLMLPGAIDAALKEIKNKYSLIVVNSKLMNVDFSEKIADKLIQIENNEIYAFSEMNQLFRRCITYMSFIGCVIIQRDLWMRRDKQTYFGTEFIHLGVIFQEPLPGESLIIAEPYIAIRYGNAQWSPRAFEIGVLKWPSLLLSFKNISKQEKEGCGCTKPWHLMRSIVMFRAKNHYSIKEYIKFIAPNQYPLWWKGGAFIVSLFPVTLLNLFILSYLMTLRRDKRIAIHDLKSSLQNQCKNFR